VVLNDESYKFVYFFQERMQLKQQRKLSRSWHSVSGRVSKISCDISWRDGSNECDFVCDVGDCAFQNV